MATAPLVRPLKESDGRAMALIIAGGIFLATALLFARACENQFVNYDDPDYVTANAHVLAGLNAAGLRWAVTAQAASNWHPLTWVSHMLDVSLFGKNPAGHHATSVLLHACNAALAFLALRRLTGSRWTSALAALLFAWHPLRVESVAWVAERKDVLSSVFFFAVLWGYAGYAERRNRGNLGIAWYAFVALMFALGLLAKPMLVTLPGVLLLLDVWPLRRLQPTAVTRPRRSMVAMVALLIVEKLPLFVLSGASCVVTYFAQQHGGAVTAALTLDTRLANAVISVFRYIGLFFWPSNLAALYPHPGPGAWSPVLIGLALVALIGITAAAWYWRRRLPWLLVGWFWFLGMLVPVIGIVQVGIQAIADRYTYLPALGLEWMLLWTARDLFGPAVRSAGAAVVGLLGALAVLTVAQIGVWRNSLVLFNHTIAVAGDGNYLAYDNRGIAWGDRGETDKAVADFEHALELNATYPNANNNLARVLADRGQLTEAIALYRTALQAKPDMLEVHNNLANALSDAGQIDAAIEHYRYVLDRAPEHLNALNGYAVALASKGQLGDAEKQLRHVLELDPSNTSAISNLGNVCAIQGRRQEAEQLFRRALQLQPNDARTWYNLGNVLTEQGRLEEAVTSFERAVQLAPVNPDAYAALGTALTRLGRPQEAIPHLRRALQQRPNFPQASAWLQAAEKAATPHVNAK